MRMSWVRRGRFVREGRGNEWDAFSRKILIDLDLTVIFYV
jgi:hypothetical protein